MEHGKDLSRKKAASVVLAPVTATNWATEAASSSIGIFAGGRRRGRISKFWMPRREFEAKNSPLTFHFQRRALGGFCLEESKKGRGGPRNQGSKESLPNESGQKEEGKPSMKWHNQTP
jgi:hypothetical protein